MRFAILLATAAAIGATPALAQTATPQTNSPQTTAPAPAADDTAAPATDAATAPSTTATPATPAPGGQVIATTATTLVQPAVGVAVFDPAGAKVGTIKAMTPQYATLTTAKGDVRLAVASIGPGPNGAVIGGTAAEIEAAAEKAASAQPTRATRRGARNPS